MNRILRAALVASLLALAGCEWADPPLAAPNAAVDAKLLGKWVSKQDREIQVTITAPKGDRYEIAVQGKKVTLRFRGYHTDVEGIRLISLELLESESAGEVKRLPPTGRERRWVCVGYSLSEDGVLEPRFLSQHILPRSQSPDDSLNVTGKQLYSSLRGYASVEDARKRFFDAGVERQQFKKEALAR